MPRENHWLDTSQPRCHLALTLAQVFDQSILSRITEQTTPETFQALQQSLSLLCTELEKQAHWRHHPATGSLGHCCVRDTYTQAAFLLKNFSLTQPVPELPPPAPESYEPSVEDVVAHFETTDEFYLGDTAEAEEEA